MGRPLPAILASLLIHGAALCFLEFPSAGGSSPEKPKPGLVTVFLAGASPGFAGISAKIREEGEGPPGGSPAETRNLRVEAPAKGQVRVAGGGAGGRGGASRGADSGADSGASRGADGGADSGAVPGAQGAAGLGISLETSFAGSDELRRLLRSLIEKRLAYPALARRRGIQGRVDLVLQIGKEGQLLSGSLSQSSGSDILDRAAGKALAGVFPLEGMRMDRVEVVRVSIDYRLP